MDKVLFAKHLHQIAVRDQDKQKIILSLKERIGIVLEESEFSLSKKKVTLSMSSVKRSILLQRGLKDLFTSLGYSLDN